MKFFEVTGKSITCAAGLGAHYTEGARRTRVADPPVIKGKGD